MKKIAKTLEHIKPREPLSPLFLFWLFSTILFLYIIFINPFPGWNENRSIDLLQAIVKEHTFKIDSFHENTGDKALYKGHYYTIGSPGIAFISMPFYLPLYLIEKFIDRTVPHTLLHVYLTVTVVCMSGAFLAVLLWVFLKDFVEDWTAFLLVLLFAFGTPEFFYSLRFHAHVPSSLFSFAAFFVLYQWKNKVIKNGLKSFFLSGLLAGVAVFVDYNAMPITFMIVFYACTLLQLRHLGIFLLGIFLGVLPLLVYHYICFDTPFTLPQKYCVYTLVNEELQILENMSIRQKIVMTLENYFRQLLGFQRGHVFFLPIFFAALYGFIRKFFNSFAKIEILFSLFLLLMYPVFIGIRPITWTGGHTFGSRYIIPTLPFMMLGVAFAISYMNRTFLLTICFFTACMNIFGVFSGTIPHGEGLTYLIRKHIQEFPMTPPFLTDRTLFPFYLAKFFVCAFFLLLLWKWGWKRITFNGAFGTAFRSVKQKNQFEENP